MRLLQSEALVLFLSLAYFLLLAPFVPGLASYENLRNVFSNMLPLLVVGIGQTYVLIGGGIDLSVTSIIALSSVVGGVLMNGQNGVLAGMPLAVPAGVLAMLMIGVILGLSNGLAITRLTMPPFIVTLTVMMFSGGFAIWLTQSQNIRNLPASFTALGKGNVHGIPLTLLVTAVLAFMAHLLLTRSLLGRWLYATGLNARAAEISGIPIKAVILSSYLVSGFCASVASILYTGRIETASPVLGQRIFLDVIAATVIGGTSLFGGKGKISWTLFGVLFVSLLDNSLNLLGLSNFMILMVKGAVILLAAVIDALRSRRT